MNELARLKIEERGTVAVASVRGELDISNSPATGDAIAAELQIEARGLIVDFSELEFLDSSAISMLFSLARRLGERRQALHVVAPQTRRGGPGARHRRVRPGRAGARLARRGAGRLRLTS